VSADRLRKTGALNPHATGIEFSQQIRDEFRNLAVALHGSEHVEPDVVDMAHDLGAGKPNSVQNAIGELMLIAQGVFAHAQATGDKTAMQAWSDASSYLCNEDAVTLKNPRSRTR